MDKNAFVRIGKARSVKLKGNEIIDRPLLDADEIIGHSEILNNKNIPTTDSVGDDSRWFKGWLGWVMGVIAAVLASAIAWKLGFS